MIVREIVHTCSNAHVARAALASIGGDFARLFAAKASSDNMPAGVLAARMVKDFARSADDDEWECVNTLARRADQPILSGLRFILSRGIHERNASAKADGAPPSYMCGSAKLSGAWTA